MIVAAVAVVLVAGFGIWWFFLRSTGHASAATSTAQLVTVTRGDMKTTVSGNGTVAAADTDNLSFASSGKVTAVNVKAGDTVTAGQVLATIDSSELQSSLSSAEANLASAQATLADAESAGSSSQQIAADKASVTSAQDSVTSAQQALSGASLVATFDGTVSQVDLTVGESLGSSGAGATTPTGSASGSGLSSPGLGSSTSPTGGTGSSSTTSSAQITVVSAGRYTVQLSIGTSDIDKVAVGQSAQLTVTTSGSSATSGLPSFLAGGGGGFPGLGGGSGATGSNQSTRSSSSSTGATATGTVTEVSKVAATSSGVATYPVTISFNAPAKDFYVGATVTGAISTATRTNVLQVSSLAITTSNGVSTVQVAKDGTTTGPTETRTVQTGLTDNGMTEITSGLVAGEKVIISLPSFPGAGSTSGRGGSGFPSGTGGSGFPTGGFPSGGFPSGGNAPSGGQ